MGAPFDGIARKVYCKPGRCRKCCKKCSLHSKKGIVILTNNLLFELQIVIPFIGLTAIGWLLVVIGFGIATFADEFDSEAGRIPRDDALSYPYWVVALCGPFIFAAAIAHAALWTPIGPIVGAVTSFLNALFLTGLGMIIFVTGNEIRFFDDVPDTTALLFAGSFLAILFWTPVMMLWHFYKVKRE